METDAIRTDITSVEYSDQRGDYRKENSFPKGMVWYACSDNQTQALAEVRRRFPL